MTGYLIISKSWEKYVIWIHILWILSLNYRLVVNCSIVWGRNELHQMEASEECLEVLEEKHFGAAYKQLRTMTDYTMFQCWNCIAAALMPLLAALMPLLAALMPLLDTVDPLSEIVVWCKNCIKNLSSEKKSYTSHMFWLFFASPSPFIGGGNSHFFFNPPGSPTKKNRDFAPFSPKLTDLKALKVPSVLKSWLWRGRCFIMTCQDCQLQQSKPWNDISKLYTPQI